MEKRDSRSYSGAVMAALLVGVGVALARFATVSAQQVSATAATPLNVGPSFTFSSYNWYWGTATLLFAVLLVACLVILWNVRLHRLVDKRTRELRVENEEKTRALEAHVESEQRFATLIEQASDGIYIADNAGNFLDVNTQGCEILGYDRDELLRLGLSDLLPRYELPRMREEWALLERGEAVVAERNLQRKDGSLVPIEASTKKLPDGRLLGIYRDISKRKTGEEVLREREVQYRRLIESANAIPYEYDLGQSRFSFVGPQAVTILGYPLARWFESDFWHRCVHPDDVEEAQSYTRQAIAAGIDHSFEYRMRHHDGRYVWVRDSVRVVMGEEGPAMVRGFLFDINERRQAEEARRESEERYRVVAKTATDALITIDENNRIVFANPATEKFFGYPVTELIGQSLGKLVPGFTGVPLQLSVVGGPGSADKSVDANGSGTADGGTGSTGSSNGAVISADADGSGGAVENQMFEVEGRRKTGERVPLEVSFGSLVRDGARQYTGIFRDISQRKHADEERMRLEAQMQHTQKLESLGVLAGGIAHDFNNLLVGILGHAELAIMDLSIEHPAREAVQEIGLAARRAADLTNQMLAFSGKGRFLVQAISLNALVGEMQHLLRTFVSKRAQMTFELAPSEPTVIGDAAQLRQVIMNLITNASDALGGRDGEVVIRTGTLHADAEWFDGAYVELDDPAGEYVFVEVTDSGCGMDPETQRRIFEPFFTTKFTGRGLGLAAVLGIVRGHQGAIKVRSRPGEGTQITVLFPLADTAVQPEPERPQTTRLGEQRYSGTILLVDDDDTVRLVGRQILRRFGFTVLTAVDGSDGVEVFRQHMDDIDVVILDMTMPGLSGEEAYAAMSELRPGVRAILSSGYSEQEATSKFADAGLAGFIQKPYMANELVEKLAGVLPVRITAEG